MNITKIKNIKNNKVNNNIIIKIYKFNQHKYDIILNK